MKVLLFANDLMPFGNVPTSGGGLRCWQLYQGLRSRGIEVVASMPAFTYLTQKHLADIPQEQRELLWNWPDQDEIYKREKPDAVLFASNFDHFNINVEMNCPLIIDLHGSRLIETQMWNTPIDTERKLSILSKADCLLSAGRRQRLYFYGWMVQAGRVPEMEHFIRYIPISLDPIQPERHPISETDTRYPMLVSGGGWFPWQNQSRAIFAACSEVTRRDAGRIELFGTPHESPGKSAEEDRIREIYAQVSALAERSERINVNGYVSRNDVLKLYSQAHVALECMEYNLERELAFTTRTIEYLWCGLPVIYNNYAEISDHLNEYQAGWCVDPTNSQQIEAALAEIFEQPELVRQKSENARALVRDRFSWDQTIQPLVEFLENPVRQPVVTPAYGAVASRASYLSPRGATVEIPVVPGAPGLVQSFTVPAEHVSSLEVSLSLANAEARANVSSVTLVVSTTAGKSIARKTFPASELPLAGKIELEFPWFRRPKGGQRLTLRLTASGFPGTANAATPLYARGLVHATYPFVDTPEAPLPQGKSLLGHSVPVAALLISFIPGTDSVYRLKMMRERAAWMLRERQYARLWHAVRKRLPRAVARARAAAGL